MNNDYMDRYERMQRLTNPIKKQSNKYKLLSLCAIGVAFIAVLVVKKPDEVKQVQKKCVQCHNKQNQLAQHLKSKGSKTPQELADALLKTKNPRLLTAIAVVETQGNSVKGGWKKQYHGVYQVHPRIHGAVKKDLLAQSLQADRIITEFTELNKGDIRKALNQYGGETSGGNGYSKKVLAELVEVPK